MSPRWLKIGLVSLLALGLVGLVLISAARPGQAAPLLAVRSAFALEATPADGAELAPGQKVTYTVTFKNTSASGEVFAAGGTLTNTFPAQLTFVSATAGYNRLNNVVTWSTPQMAFNDTFAVTVTAQLPVTQNILHASLADNAAVKVTVQGSGASHTKTDSVSHSVPNAGVVKVNTTAINVANNTEHMAVAGEAITVLITFTIPQGTIGYDVTPRVLLQDGISLTGASKTYTFTTNQTVPPMDPVRFQSASRCYTLVQFPSLTITDTDGGPRVLTYTLNAVQRQQYALGCQTGDIPHSSPREVIQPILRWCDTPGCQINPASTVYYKTDTTDNATVSIVPVRPLVTPAFTHTYLDSPATNGRGGGRVRFTIANQNATGRPTAYDMVLTATLGAGLTYASSNGGTPVGNQVVWNVPVNLNAGQTWNAYITATLPNTFVIGANFTATASMLYQTFAGAVAHEGEYVTPAAVYSIAPGLAAPTKQVKPTDNVKIGDTVVYTVVTTLGGNTILYSPYYVDTLPSGFHYVSGTLSAPGVTVTSIATSTTTSKLEKLTWRMAHIDNRGSANPKVVTVAYRAIVSGLNTSHEMVYTTLTEIRAKQTAENSAQLYWLLDPDEPDSVLSLTAVKSTTRVAQPYMGTQGTGAPLPKFETSRVGTGNVEVGATVYFQTIFRNSTQSGATAYDAQVCDVLPQGFAFEATTPFVPPAGCSGAAIVSEPQVGATGNICWVFNQVCAGALDFTLQYRATVLPTALPGPQRFNNASIADYSSQPGAASVERHYKDLPNPALPANKQCGAPGCPFTVLGLEAHKTAWKGSVRANDRLTYTLSYADTSAAHIYTGIVITDVYDAYMSFVSAEPAPAVNDPARRLLVWNIPSLADGGAGQITLTMQVQATLPGTLTQVVNTMRWDSDQMQTPLEEIEITPVGATNLHLTMSGPANTSAGGALAYTLVYSNDGSASQPVTLTLNYGPYLIYNSATLTPVPDTNGTVFVDNTLPNDGSNHTLTIQLTTRAPLPYALTEINSSAVLASAGSPFKSAAWTMDVQRPILDLRKTGPDEAPLPGQEMRYNFYLANTGDIAATNLIITDTWDVNTSFASGTGWTLGGGNTYATYVIPSLAPGMTATIQPLYVLVNAAVVPYVNQAQLRSDQTTPQTIWEKTYAPSLATRKVVEPEPAFPGRPLTYTIYYTNTSLLPIANAVVTDHLPSAALFAYVGCSQPAGWNPCIHMGDDVIWTRDYVPAGETGQFVIWGKVTGDENTWLVNTTVSDGDNPVPKRLGDVEVRTRIARPWLGLSKFAVDPRPVAPGQNLTYTLVYSNYGSDTAYDVVVVDRLPTQVEYVSCDPACAHNAGVVTWNIPSVPTDTLGYLTLVVQAQPGTAGQAAINADYTIQCSLALTDTWLGPDVSVEIRNPQLSLSKAAQPSVVTAQNDPITYTITYINDGGSGIDGVIITDTLSNLVQFVDASSGCVYAGTGIGGVVTCTIGHVGQGQSGVIQIRARNATTLQGAQITNQAEGDSAQTEPTVSNETRVWFYGDGCVPILETGTDFGSTSPVPLGQTMHFTATYWPPEADTPVTFGWDFGGAGSGSGTGTATPSYDYTSAGTYTVTLTVDNACSALGVVVKHRVTVSATSHTVFLPLVLKNP